MVASYILGVAVHNTSPIYHKWSLTWLVIDNFGSFKSLELMSRVKTKQQKMLLSLRSNPQCKDSRGLASMKLLP